MGAPYSEEATSSRFPPSFASVAPRLDRVAGTCLTSEAVRPRRSAIEQRTSPRSLSPPQPSNLVLRQTHSRTRGDERWPCALSTPTTMLSLTSIGREPPSRQETNGHASPCNGKEHSLPRWCHDRYAPL